MRWLLDYSKIPYEVVNWVPLVHAPAAYLKSGKRTVPFIEVNDGSESFVVHDSTDIIKWVHQRFKPLALIPDNAEIYEQAMFFEDRADSVGDDVIRYMYAPMMEQPDDFVAVWGWGAKPVHQRLLRFGLPVIRSLLDGHLDFSLQGRKAGMNRLNQMFQELDEHLSDGREFLIADQLSIADISVASLLAPVYAPDTHIVYTSETFRNTLTTQQSEFESYASFSWMRKLYADHRY